MDWYEQRDPISFPAVEEGFGQFLDTLVQECSHDPYESEDPSVVKKKNHALLQIKSQREASMPSKKLA